MCLAYGVVRHLRQPFLTTDPQYWEEISFWDELQLR